jgi:hypothetical protein
MSLKTNVTVPAGRFVIGQFWQPQHPRLMRHLWCDPTWQTILAPG